MPAPEPTLDHTSAADVLDAPDDRAFTFLQPPAQPGDLGRLGPYRVVKLLGEGGMGFVFRGEDDGLCRPVALKVMRPEAAAGANARERFLREGRAAAAVKSDHVVTIYQVGEENGVPFLAMEFLAGATLEDWMRNRPTASPTALLKVARDTLRGLAAAHERGLIHRDIKPANLWLEAGTGRVKVLDFGLTRGPGGDTLTREGVVVGTPSYMAPEQAAGQPVDPRADLFSLGVVSYRMATGRNPFQRGDVFATLTALAVEVPPPVAGLPPGLGEFIDRLVAKNPAERPESARAALAIVAELEKAFKGGAPTVMYAPPVVAANPWAEVTAGVSAITVPVAPVEPPHEAPRRKRSLAVGVAGLAAVVAVTVGLAVGSGARTNPTAKAEPPPTEKVVRAAPKASDELLVPAAGPAFVARPSPFDALDPARVPAAEREPGVVAVAGGRRGAVRSWMWEGPIVFSPDGKWFATGYPFAEAHRGVSVYRTDTLEFVWDEPKGGAVAFGAGWAVVSLKHPADGRHGLRLLDLTGPSPRADKELDFTPGTATTALAALGKTVLVGTAGGGLFACDTGAEPRVLRDDGRTGGRAVRTLAVSADGRRFADAGGLSAEPTFVNVWDAAAATELARLPEAAKLRSVALTPDGGRLVLLRDESAAADAVEVWRLDGPQPTRAHSTTLAGHFSAVGPVSRDGTTAFLGGARAVLLDLGSAKTHPLGDTVVAAGPDVSPLIQLAGSRFRVLSREGNALVEPGEAVCGPDAVPVAAGGRVFTFHPRARAWAVKDGGLFAESFELAEDRGVMRATATDGRAVAGIGPDFALRAYSVGPTGALTGRVPAGELFTDRAARFAWHPDGRHVVAASADGVAYTWDVTADPARRTLVGAVSPPERAATLHLAVAPAGDVLAACDPPEPGAGPTLRRLDAPKTSARVLAGVPGEYALSSQFLPDGRSLLVAFRKDNEPYRVRHYDLTRREPVAEQLWEFAARPQTGGEGMHVIQLSRDGTRVLGFVSTRMYVVDVATRRELIGVDLGEQIHLPSQGQVRWADDGRHILLGQHGCVYVLRVP